MRSVKHTLLVYDLVFVWKQTDGIINVVSHAVVSFSRHPSLHLLEFSTLSQVSLSRRDSNKFIRSYFEEIPPECDLKRPKRFNEYTNR